MKQGYFITKDYLEKLKEEFEKQGIRDCVSLIDAIMTKTFPLIEFPDQDEIIKEANNYSSDSSEQLDFIVGANYFRNKFLKE